LVTPRRDHEWLIAASLIEADEVKFDRTRRIVTLGRKNFSRPAAIEEAIVPTTVGMLDKLSAALCVPLKPEFDPLVVGRR